jgi:hypothetical protein
MAADPFDELRAEADATLEEAAIPEHWGTEVKLAEGEEFGGRFRRTEVDDRWDTPRSVYLLLDRDGQLCFLRGGRKVLDRQMEKASPGEGDWILVKRGEDGVNPSGQTYFNYAVKTRPCTDPLPAERMLESGAGGLPELDDDIPF